MHDAAPSQNPAQGTGSLTAPASEQARGMDEKDPVKAEGRCVEHKGETMGDVMCEMCGEGMTEEETERDSDGSLVHRGCIEEYAESVLAQDG